MFILLLLFVIKRKDADGCNTSSENAPGVIYKLVIKWKATIFSFFYSFFCNYTFSSTYLKKNALKMPKNNKNFFKNAAYSWKSPVASPITADSIHFKHKHPQNPKSKVNVT